MLNGTIDRLERREVNQRIVDSVNALLDVLHPGGKQATIGQLNEAVSSSNVFLAYTPEGKVVGMATLIVQERVAKTTGYMQDVAVLPEEEGKGFGRALVGRILQEARERECVHIDFTSGADRTRAHDLYHQMGAEERSTHNFRFTL